MAQMNLLAGQKYKCRHGKQPCGYEAGGKGGTNWKIRVYTHTHTLPCVKYLASGNLLNNTGNYTWGSVMTQRSGTGGGRSKRESIYVYI